MPINLSDLGLDETIRLRFGIDLPQFEWQKVGRVAVGTETQGYRPGHVQETLPEEGLPSVVVGAHVFRSSQTLPPVSCEA